MKRVYYLGFAALILVFLWILLPQREDKRVFDSIRKENTAFSFVAAGNKMSGWKQVGNEWFYYDPFTGKMSKGWVQISSKWYYLDTKTGAMKIGWQKIGKYWYYFDTETGRMKTNWFSTGKNWYYFEPETGHMATGWNEIRGRWYYFDLNSGRMKTGWLALGKYWYYFEAETGRMKTGWVEDRDKWYYFGDDGRMCVGWISRNGKKYYLNENGAVVSGWLEIDSKYYYFEESGEMKTGWLDWKGKKYLFKENGEMAAGEVAVYNGKRYAFSGKGDWLGEKRASFLDAYARAAEYVNQYTDDSMTDIQKLRVCYDLFATFTEKNPWIPHYKGEDWVEVYANDCLKTRVSNCLGYGASLGLMARVIGFDDVYCCNSGGHGWVEIKNLVYDPEWTLHHEGNFFGRPIVRGEKQDYSVAVDRSKEYWGYVRI